MRQDDFRIGSGDRSGGRERSARDGVRRLVDSCSPCGYVGPCATGYVPAYTYRLLFRLRRSGLS